MFVTRSYQSSLPEATYVEIVLTETEFLTIKRYSWVLQVMKATDHPITNSESPYSWHQFQHQSVDYHSKNKSGHDIRVKFLITAEHR